LDQQARAGARKDGDAEVMSGGEQLSSVSIVMCNKYLINNRMQLLLW
jgi:hypothetical protein